MSFIRIWQFRVASGRADEFREVYGPEGAWATLFSREQAFLGTDLFQSATDPELFITIDSWDSPEAWAAFLRTWGDDYAILDRRCDELIVSEREVGSFLELAIAGGAAHHAQQNAVGNDG
ncbi:MAG TPA: antibiotic biosynthesis monooxygenase family protein [Gemmatimonadales bacterium]|nr:antibiotic biosynthesis monooxygenase family protein [Gemmatimonadales bacterium]